MSITQDQLEMARQVAATMLAHYSSWPEEQQKKELSAVAYKLARVAGFVDNKPLLESFQNAIVQMVKHNPN